MRIRKKFIIRNMPAHELDHYWFQYNRLKKELDSGKPILEVQPQIEDALLEITRLKSYPYAINSYNVYYIKDGLLTDAEISFMEQSLKYVDINVLRKASYMRTFLVECLKNYHRIVDPQTSTTLEPLRKIFPVIREFLN